MRLRSKKAKKEEAGKEKVSSPVNAQEEQGNDTLSILLLLLLYTLQGIPMGLSSSIPFILQSKVGYADQATFSLVSWPFSLKLFWAPFVDSVYSHRFGRRKSWLVPVQLLCGVLMVAGRMLVESWLAEEEGQEPQVYYLTSYFFLLYTMMATQDIAVDGWALTMLSKKNVSYASTCNTVGQTLGYFVAYAGFLALHDAETCNSYLRSEPSDVGMVTLPDFLGFWGWVMIITTIGVWLFKRESPVKEEHVLGVKETYQQLWRVLRLPAVIELSVVLLTCKIGFAAAEAVAPLKLVEYGLKKEKLALLTPILIPLGIIIPIFLSRYSAGKSPLTLFLYGYPFRLVVGLLYAGIVYATPIVMSHHEDFHYYYYGFILLSGALHELAANMMFVSVMSFFAKISDPSIGGTYMTFLNTIANLGSKWPTSLSLAFVDTLTHRECIVPNAKESNALTCSEHLSREACTELGGACVTLRDGFFVETAICVGIGLLWLVVFYSRVNRLQYLKEGAWCLKAD